MRWLVDEAGIVEPAAEQLVEYLAAGHAALGVLPTLDTLVFERFFDEAGGMQLVIHSPYGSRINRAWGLALRKRFCRKFNFELQAAATEDNIVLSLTGAHSFDLAEVAHYLHSASIRQLLIEALLDAPMFITRWRWVAGVSLALPRFRGGRKVPPQLARMAAEDLIAAIFPDQVACAENLAGAREIPDHPLIRQTIADCLGEAMDLDGLTRLLARLEAGDIRVVARDLTEPSPLALEVLSARPYAYLDDAPLEERRTQAVMSPPLARAGGGERYRPARSGSDRAGAGRSLARPGERGRIARRASLARFSRRRGGATPGWSGWFDELARDRRAARLFIPPTSAPASSLPRERGRVGWGREREVDIGERSGIPHLTPTLSAPRGREGAPEAGVEPPPGGKTLWIAAERLPQFQALWPEARLDPPIAAPAPYSERVWSPEDALVEILRGRLEGLGPVAEAALAEPLGLAPKDIAAALAALETEGFAMRGRFTPGAAADEWCERRLLARIHRYTVNRLRAEIQPVAARDFLRFLLDWQRVAPETRMEGPDALEILVRQLEGFEAAAGAWETEILPARLDGYEPSWLDDQCLAGRVAWARLRPRNGRANGGERSATPVRTTPITLLARRHAGLWASLVRGRRSGPPELAGAGGRRLHPPARRLVFR